MLHLIERKFLGRVDVKRRKHGTEQTPHSIFKHVLPGEKDHDLTLFDDMVQKHVEECGMVPPCKEVKMQFVAFKRENRFLDRGFDKITANLADLLFSEKGLE